MTFTAKQAKIFSLQTMCRCCVFPMLIMCLLHLHFNLFWEKTKPELDYATKLLKLVPSTVMFVEM